MTHCSQKVLLRIAFCMPLKIVESLWNLNFLNPLMKMTQGMRAQRNRSQLVEHYLRITYSTQDNMNIKKTDAIIMYCEKKKMFKMIHLWTWQQVMSFLNDLSLSPPKNFKETLDVLTSSSIISASTSTPAESLKTTGSMQQVELCWSLAVETNTIQFNVSTYWNDNILIT